LIAVKTKALGLIVTFYPKIDILRKSGQYENDKLSMYVTKGGIIMDYKVTQN
jgi:hypothetical protein